MKTEVKSVSLITTLLLIIFGTIGCSTNLISTQNKTYKIGERGPAGGWIFYDKGHTSDGWRYLEAAQEDQSAEAEWGYMQETIPGARGTDIGTGKANTAAIIANCEKSGIAAQVAVAYRGGSKSDWFLPSKDELNLMYTNLKKIGVGGFVNALYWSSSEVDSDWRTPVFSACLAWSQVFTTGFQVNNGKNRTYRVRAVRAF